jgi:hypothetical protein
VAEVTVLIGTVEWCERASTSLWSSHSSGCRRSFANIGRALRHPDGTIWTGIIGLLAWSARSASSGIRIRGRHLQRSFLQGAAAHYLGSMRLCPCAVIRSASMTCPCSYAEEDTSGVVGLMLCRRHKQCGRLPLWEQTKLQLECLTRMVGACVVNGLRTCRPHHPDNAYELNIARRFVVALRASNPPQRRPGTAKFPNHE